MSKKQFVIVVVCMLLFSFAGGATVAKIALIKVNKADKSEDGVHDVIKTKAILIVDEDGTTRAGIGQLPDGNGTAFFLNSEEGELKASFGHLPDKDLTALYLYDVNKKPRVSLGFLDDMDMGMLNFIDVYGNKSIVLSQNGELNLGALYFFGDSDTPRIAIGHAVGEDDATLNIFNKDGDVIWIAP